MHPRFRAVAALAIVAYCESAAVLADPPSPDEIRTAIARSVTFLENDMRDWRAVRKCGACHHAPPALVTLREAAAKGLAIDRAAYDDLRIWSLAHDRARLVPKPAANGERPELALQAVYFAWTLAGDHVEDAQIRSVRQRLGEHLRQSQQPDGAWRGPAGHPPVFASPTEVTLMVLLSARGTPALSTSLEPSLSRAEAWLRQQPESDSLQELAFRTLWAAQSGQTSEARVLAQRLVEAQQPDGGWRQTIGMPSDALAAGESLVALSAAGIAANDVSIQRAARFLISTQNADGTWTMISRPDPKNGRAAENLNPITYAGTAWATRGLLTLLNEP